MEYQVRTARIADLDRICEIYAYARQFMADHGNPNQWGKTTPAVEQLVEDIGLGRLYVLCTGEAIHGVFYFSIGEDPTYGYIAGGWGSSTPYGTIHRIAGDGSGGVLKTAVAFAKKQIGHIRIDTHQDNTVMQNALGKLGFVRRGIIYIADGSPRIAYDHLT